MMRQHGSFEVIKITYVWDIFARTIHEDEGSRKVGTRWRFELVKCAN